MAVDTTITFNGHNSYKITENLFCYPFGVQGMSYITHSFQAYATSMLASATRAKTKFFDADGALLSDVSHAFAVTTVFGKVEITVAVPATATQAQLMLIQGGTDWWIAEPKSEQGQVATPYNVNYAGQLTYITPNGIYTGMMTTGQIVVTGSVSNPDETLDTRLVTINNGVINLTSTVSAKTTKITNEGVYTGEVAADQITVGQIVGPQIADGAVTYAKIADLAVTGAKIANATITNAKISDLHGSKITANSITADKINVTDLYVDTLRAINDNGKYVKFSSESDDGTMNFYSTMSGGSAQQRGYIRMFGTSVLAFWGIPRTGVSPNYEGTTMMSIRHGQSGLSLSDPSQMNNTSLSLGDKQLGIDATGFYKSTDNGITKSYF